MSNDDKDTFCEFGCNCTAEKSSNTLGEFDNKAQIGFDLSGSETEFGSIFDVVSDVASGAWNAATSVVETALDIIPGARAITDAMGDFAKTGPGQVLTRAFATMLTGGLVPYLGPQLATVAWAVPGLAAGDKNFVTAWTKEFKWRVETTAEIMGADVGKLIGDQVTQTLDKLHLSNFTDKIMDSIPDFANKFGIRQDAAALVKSAWNGSEIPSTLDYNAATGVFEQERPLAAGLGIGDPTAVVAASVHNRILANMLGNHALIASGQQAQVQQKKMGKVHKKRGYTGPLLTGVGIGLLSSLAFGLTLPMSVGMGVFAGSAMLLRK